MASWIMEFPWNYLCSTDDAPGEKIANLCLVVLDNILRHLGPQLVLGNVLVVQDKILVAVGSLSHMDGL